MYNIGNDRHITYLPITVPHTTSTRLEVFIAQFLERLLLLLFYFSPFTTLNTNRYRSQLAMLHSDRNLIAIYRLFCHPIWTSPLIESFSVHGPVERQTDRQTADQSLSVVKAKRRCCRRSGRWRRDCQSPIDWYLMALVSICYRFTEPSRRTSLVAVGIKRRLLATSRRRGEERPRHCAQKQPQQQQPVKRNAFLQKNRLDDSFAPRRGGTGKCWILPYLALCSFLSFCSGCATLKASDRSTDLPKSSHATEEEVKYSLIWNQSAKDVDEGGKWKFLNNRSRGGGRQTIRRTATKGDSNSEN